MLLVKLISCLFGITFCLQVFSQSYSFRHYQVENGLSNNSVTCSLQDKKGFMWFGTKDGLNRFDGYSFKVFKKIEGNPKSIGNNFIHCLYEDRNGILWAGTEQGLYEYSSATEDFKLVSGTAKMFIDNIVDDTSGNIWLISYYQLYRYEKKARKMYHYDKEIYFTPTAFGTTKDGTVWIGSADGHLKKYHSNTNSFSEIDIFAHDGSAGSRWIESISPITDNCLVVGTTESQVKLIDLITGSYSNIPLVRRGNPTLYVKNFLQTSPGIWWFGTESGLFIHNRNTGTTEQITKDYNDPYSITDNYVTSMSRDREGGVWVGTYYGGINYYPNQTTFTKYFPQKGENSLSGNVIGQIKEDHDGNLWIATEDAGLNKLDRKSNTFTHFQAEGNKGSIAYFEIHGLLVVGDEVWIGTYQHGLDVLNIRTGKVVRHYEAGTSGLTHNYIYNIYQSETGEILVCTALGVFVYDRTTDKFKSVKGLQSEIWYTAIVEDKKKRLWGATFGYGLHLYDSASGKAETFLYNEKDTNSLSSNRVTSLFQDSKNNLWVATEAGLCRWNETRHNFTRYNLTNGFPSNFILSLLEDDQQNLWISTTKGLVRFQPTTGRIEIFTTANGLISDQFSYHSAFKNKDGLMYFGTAKGLISFNPADFTKKSFIPPVYLTGFIVNGKEVAIDQRGSPLKESITYTDEITLSHTQSNFSLDFAALSFTAPEVLQYKYQMEGLSKSWNDLKGNRRVDFIGMSPGTYTFKIKASSLDGVWTKETRLRIVILPPWWKSNWAYALYILFTALLVYLVLRFYYKRIQEKNKRKIELLKIENEKEMLRVELVKEKELAEAKLDFFTKVAHEIRTPLTLIKVPLMKIIKKASGIPELQNSLTIMERNTNRLVALTNQLLDFRQIETNKFSLYFEKLEVTKLVSESASDFCTLAEQNNIYCSVHMPQDPLYAYLDADAFHKIISNLFSNAVKYAKQKVDVSLSYHPAGNLFILRVKNDGYLVPDDMKEKIFEPFYRIQETESQTGTGIGLALARSLARLHGGTLTLEPAENNMNVFSLTLPTQLENELISQSQETDSGSLKDNHLR